MVQLQIIILGFLMISALPLKAQNAKEIIKKSHEQMRGETSKATMNMQIIRPTWERKVSFKTWSKGTQYSMTLITAPANEKGQTYLKRGNEMWNYNPTINRLIKLPPSMMSQGWLGSDFTNDDMLNEASIVVDYNHKLKENETISGRDCYIIELIPKEDAPVVWGKIEMWVDKEHYFEMKAVFYDEDMQPEKTHLSSEIKTMNGRKIPTVFSIIPSDKEDQKTKVTIQNIEFNINLPEAFFSRQNMKRLRE